MFWNICNHIIAVPIIYEVHRLRDGNNFATRRVDAIQKGNVIFTLLASFQVIIHFFSRTYLMFLEMLLRFKIQVVSFIKSHL